MPVKAQHYQFDHWTTDNGLPQNTVRNVLQSRDGYLWLITFDGLVRFDGSRFYIFDHDNTPEIVNNRLMYLCESADGTLYMAPESGGILVYQQGHFSLYTTANGLPQGVCGGFLSDIKGETLILLNDNNNNTSYYLRDNKFIPAPPEYKVDSNKKFIAGSTGRLWGVDRQGITLRVGESMTRFPLSLTAQDIAGQVSLYEDRTGGLWISDLNRLYHLQNGKVISYGKKDGLPVDEKKGDSQGSTTTIRGFCEDLEGNLWFTLGWHRRDDNRLAVMKDGQVTIFGPETGFPKTDIGGMIADREGAVWIGTSSGLFRARKQIINTYSTSQGLAAKEVYPIFQRRDGAMLIGTTQGVSLFRQERFQTIIPLNTLENGFGAAQALYEDAKNNIWLGAMGGMGRFENGKLKEKILSGASTVSVITQDQKGNIWAGAHDGLYQLENNRIVRHFTTADGLPNNDVKVIREARDGSLWLGTYGGLAHFRDGRFTSWTSRDGLPSDSIRTLYEDAEGILWIGTYDSGLSRFQNGKFVNYNTQTGLFNNGVFAILEDLHGNFWMSCNRGIYRANRNELNEVAIGKRSRINSIAYDKSDGMLNIECNGGRQPAALIARDGKFWFATQDGVAVVDPDAIGSNSFPPPVEIEAVSIDRTPIKMDVLKSILGNPSAAIMIDPGQTSLDITYTALSLTKSDLIRFRYKLKGLSNEWEEAGARRTAYFSYLPPGNYTFQVVAANADGVWNTVGKEIKIKVIPPIYRRWWFILIATGVTMGLFIASYKYRVNQLKRERDLQQEYARRLINAHDGERKRIAAELHDGLSQSLAIIRQRATICLQSKDDPMRQHEQMEAIAESATAVIDEVRGIVYDLRPVQLDLLGLTNSLHELLDKIERTHHFKIKRQLVELAGQLSPEIETNLYRIVQEAMNNIVRHANAGIVNVMLRREGNLLHLRIDDDGCGFSSEAQPKFKNDSGLGLTSMQERARVLHGKLLIESTPSKGTMITLHIPID